MLALILMYFAKTWFGVSVGHLMDQKYLSQPMSWEKARSILDHLWIRSSSSVRRARLA